MADKIHGEIKQHPSTEKYGEGITGKNQLAHAPIPGHHSTAKYRGEEETIPATKESTEPA